MHSGDRGTIVHPMLIEELLNVEILMNLDGSIIAVLNLHAEKPHSDSEILHIESFTKAAFDYGDIILVVTKVIDVKSDICVFAICILEDENAGIRFTLLEVEINQDYCNRLKPCSGGMF